MRLVHVDEPPASEFLLGGAVSLLLAYLSFRYVERPFRLPARYSRKQVFAAAALMLALCLGLGMLGHMRRGFPERFDSTDYSASMRSSPKREACHAHPEKRLLPADSCRYFTSNTTWAVLGDSHVVEIAHALAQRLKPAGEGIVHMTFSGCAPALTFTARRTGCTEWMRSAVATLEREPSIGNVWLGFRYSNFLYGQVERVYPELPSAHPRRRMVVGAEVSRARASELYFQGLSQLVERLLAAGKRVVVMYPIPELPVDLRKLIVPVNIFGTRSRLDLERTLPADYYRRRNGFILRKLDSLPYSERLVAVRPFDALCAAGFCPAVHGGEALYFDGHHVSLAGARPIVAALPPPAGTQ